MNCVYILYSKTRDKYYIGSTIDIERRLCDHNYGNTASTKGGRPWICVFTMETSSLSEARALERRLKSYKSRVVIEKMINEGYTRT
ncbi:MAG: GIY-YIG nuclease family protein [Patescibacteria group bacterium]|nr:GIY-YIG nuclease family protein [Patescibacteria group bacterium]